MKKKGYAKGGMKKKGYAKGGAAKKMHIGGTATVPPTQTVSGTGLQALGQTQPMERQAPAQAPAQLGLSNSYAQSIAPAQAPALIGTTMPSPSSAMQDVGSKGAVGTTMPAPLSPMQDVGMGVGDVGVGDFMNSQRPQKLDINLGRQTAEASASAPPPLSPFKPALGKIGAMKKGGSVAKRKKGGSVVRRKGGGSILNKKGYAKGGATRIF
tara:strand:+ start:327 stop:959 length:633 start_codon:yes stop_codon:yes gene_type:complete